MEPFYFGSSERPLFGVYHAPTGAPLKDGGVVLCYPMGHEYMQTHRAFRQLATHLSTHGFHVLRFDYYGSGDSGGESNEGTIQQWRQDIATAIEEVSARSGAGKVCLIGYRLGGTLAALQGVEQGNIEAVVLWDPIVDGRAYLETMMGMHQQKVEKLWSQAKPPLRDNQLTEILGYAYRDRLLIDLENINLTEIRGEPGRHILVVESNEDASARELSEHFGGLGIHCEYKYLPGPKMWRENINRIMVPVPIIRFLNTWLSEVFS